VAGALLLFIAAVSLSAGGPAQEKKAPWPWPASLDAVAAAPVNHRVMYEDDKIRILNVNNQAGSFDNWHAHEWSSIFIVDEPQPKGRDFRWDGTVQEVYPTGADAPFPLINRHGPESTHSFENLDTFGKHFYRIEFKKLDFGPVAAGAPVPKVMLDEFAKLDLKSWPWPDSLDAVQASPMNHKVLCENDDIRILEVNIPAGTKEKMHDHRYSSVFIFDQPEPKGQDVSGDASNLGKVAPIDRTLQGADFPVIRRQGPQGPHAFENTDTFAFHFYRVEFKKLHFVN